MKKSALSAAIAGGTVPPPALPPKGTGAAGLLGPGQREEDYPFPCLLCAKDDPSAPAAASPSSSNAEALAGEVAELKLDKSFVPAGSLPTHVGGLADYPLAPHQRRSGKEASAQAAAAVDEQFDRLGSLPPAGAGSRRTSITGGAPGGAPGGFGSSLPVGSAAAALGASLRDNYDAVVGSLPRAMTAAERQRVRAATPMSPSIALLQELGPLDRVGARTADGRRLRRHALKGAVVAFVTAGYSGKRFIFEKAKELGVRTIILDAADSWAQLLVEEGVAEKFVPIDFAESDTVFEQCLKGLKKAAAEMGSGSGGGSSGGGGGSGSIDGVTTFCELAVPLVARLAEALGLPGNSPDAVDAARDKYETRAAMAKAGLPTPRNARISKPEDVDPAGQHVGFPAVIKPVSGAASIGVVRVNDAQALREAYERVARDMSRARVVAGALVEGHDDDDDEEEGARPAAAAGNNASATSQGEGGAAGSAGAGGPDGSAPSITKKAKGAASSWINVELMLEEYLDGPEVDCDLILSQGSCVYGAVTDNWPTVEPYFNETGSNCPSILSRSTQKELLELSVASVRALGLKEGVFHVEAKATSRGARLIEVNCRMGGGPVRDTNLLVWGVDLVEEHLMTAAGIPSRPPIARKPLVNMAEYSINADKSGVLERDDFLAEWASHPDVLYARPLAKAGERVVCVADGLPTWICELMVVKPRVEEAIEFVKGIEKAISPLPIKAVAAGK